jgi:hypothetical protein
VACQAFLRHANTTAIDRRQSMTTVGSTLAVAGASSPLPAQVSPNQKAYGSGSFDEWIEDEFGLPLSAALATKPAIRKPSPRFPAPAFSPPPITSIWLENDRLVATVSN